MRRLFMLAALAALCRTGAPAQLLVDQTGASGWELAAAFERYWKNPTGGTLKASVEKLRPWMDYGLRAWAGYSAEVDARQFDPAKPHVLVAAFRVTPLDPSGPPALFYWRADVAPAGEARPRQATVWRFSGGWLMGPGEYRVDWILVDEQSRVRRQSWKIKAPAGNSPSPLAPGSVQESGPGIWKGFAASDRASRLQVFIDASPIRPHRYPTSLPAWDRQVLLSSLGALLRDGGFSAARVTVLDMERRQVRFDAPEFDPRQLRALRNDLAHVDLGTIEFDILKERPAENAFLEAELAQAARSARPPDAVVFLGSSWRESSRAPEPSPALKERVPACYFIAFTRPGMVPQGAVARLVGRLKGRVFSVARPEDLAGAVREIRARQATNLAR